MKRKTIIGGIVTVGVLGTTTVAWAFITGILNVPNTVQGLVQGGGAVSCQSGSAVVFDVPEPTWNNSIGSYTVSTLDYSNITTSCVNLGTADLIVNITTSGSNSSIAAGQANNLGSATGTIVLSQPVEFDVITTANINFLVQND